MEHENPGMPNPNPADRHDDELPEGYQFGPTGSLDPRVNPSPYAGPDTSTGAAR